MQSPLDDILKELKGKKAYVYSGDHRRIAFQELNKEKPRYVMLITFINYHN